MANEKRLIDSDKLRGLKYEKVKFSDYREGWNDAIDTILTEVFSPTVDAVEVVHGRCKWCNGDYHTKIMATAIRYHSNGNIDGYELKVNYCPNCGAKLDGNKDGSLLFADMEEIIDATD